MFKKRRAYFIPFIGLLLLVISGCFHSNADDQHAVYTIIDGQLLQPDLKELLIESAVLHFGEEVSDIRISEVNRVDNLLFITFLFNVVEDPYIGIIHVKEIGGLYDLGYIDGYKINGSKDLSVIGIHGNVGLDDPDRSYVITLGTIHNDRIQNIYISYPDGDVSEIILEENQQTYTEIKMDLESSPINIKAIAEDGEVIYEE